MSHLNTRELKVLQALSLGDIEDGDHFGGIGAKTFQGLLEKGWIEQSYDDVYGTDGYKITAAGEAILDEM